MRVLTLSAGTSATVVPWTVDKDTAIVGGHASKAALLTYDGAMIISDYTGPTVSSVRLGAIILAFNSANTPVSGLNIPLSLGETVYLVSSGGLSMILFLEDVS